MGMRVVGFSVLFLFFSMEIITTILDVQCYANMKEILNTVFHYIELAFSSEQINVYLFTCSLFSLELVQYAVFTAKTLEPTKST